MTTKYKKPQDPSAYRLGLDCGHSPIVSAETLKQLRVESHYEPTESMFTTSQHTDVIVCPDCRDRKPGSCDYTPLHKIVMATPVFMRQLASFEQPKQPQEQEQEQEQPSS